MKRAWALAALAGLALLGTACRGAENAPATPQDRASSTTSLSYSSGDNDQDYLLAVYPVTTHLSTLMGEIADSMDAGSIDSPYWIATHQDQTRELEDVYHELLAIDNSDLSSDLRDANEYLLQSVRKFVEANQILDQAAASDDYSEQSDMLDKAEALMLDGNTDVDRAKSAMERYTEQE